MKKNTKKTVILFLCVLTIMTVIFLFSSQSGDDSGRLSEKVSRIISKIIFFNFDTMTVEKQNFIVSELNSFVRKLAHFSVYTVLGMFVYMAVLTFGDVFKHKRTIALGLCALYAAADEIHQYFIPSRTMRLRDVIIDSTGSLFGIIIISVIVIVIEHLKATYKKALI